MLTPLGVLGGIRGVFFANMGGAHFDGQPFKWLSNRHRVYTPIVGYNVEPADGSANPDLRDRRTAVSGLRLVDARASYGMGLETFAPRFPGPLRLGLEDALQQGLGRRAVRGAGRQQRVPQAEVRAVDWVRLLIADSSQRASSDRRRADASRPFVFLDASAAVSGGALRPSSGRTQAVRSRHGLFRLQAPLHISVCSFDQLH